LMPKVFHVALIGYSVAMFLTQQVWEGWLRYGVLYPHFGR
jgi:hypothetical protein